MIKIPESIIQNITEIEMINHTYPNLHLKFNISDSFKIL